MQFDLNAFTPSRTAGGLLIGVAAAALMMLNGFVAGISGVLCCLRRDRVGGIAWRAAFVGSLPARPAHAGRHAGLELLQPSSAAATPGGANRRLDQTPGHA